MRSKSKPELAARRWTLRASRSAGRFSGTSPKMPSSRPGSARLIWSQLCSTSRAVRGVLPRGILPRVLRRLGFLRPPLNGRATRGLLAEDVRVTADQLLAAVLGHGGQVARAALLEQQREEVDLEEHVAELVEQLGVVSPSAASASS